MEAIYNSDSEVSCGLSSSELSKDHSYRRQPPSHGAVIQHRMIPQTNGEVYYGTLNPIISNMGQEYAESLGNGMIPAVLSGGDQPQLQTNRSGTSRNLLGLLGSWIKGSNINDGSIDFDDEEMVVVPADIDSDQELSETTPYQDAEYNVPMGYLEQCDYSEQDIHPRRAALLNMVHSLPGAQQFSAARQVFADRANTTYGQVNASYDIVMEHAGYSFRRTQEAVVLSGQVGHHLVGEAWTASQNAAIRVQENWPDVMRPVADGVFGRFGRFIRESSRVIPPHDCIVRGNRHHH